MYPRPRFLARGVLELWKLCKNGEHFYGQWFIYVPTHTTEHIAAAYELYDAEHLTPVLTGSQHHCGKGIM